MPWQSRPHDPRYSTTKWRRARRAALERAGYRCEARTPGICTGRATEVDHLTSVDADPDHQHLQALCGPCHRAKTTAASNKARARARAVDPDPRPWTGWT